MSLVEIEGGKWFFEEYEKDKKQVKTLFLCGDQIRYPEVRETINKFFEEKEIEPKLTIFKDKTCIAITI